MARCYDCQNFLNVCVKKTGGGVRFSREEFVAWKLHHLALLQEPIEIGHCKRFRLFHSRT
jgi:hypothetical protein